MSKKYRKYVSLILFFLFICSSITGYFLYKGKGDTWGGIHTVSSFTIFFVIILHLVYNFYTFLNYLKNMKALFLSILFSVILILFFVIDLDSFKNNERSIESKEFGALVSDEEVKDHIIFKRRSVREFSGEQIKDKEQEFIIRAGLQSPTAKNQRAYEMIIIKDNKQLEELSNVSPYAKPLRNGTTFAVVVIANKNKGESIENIELDCANVMMNMWLMSTSLNLGAVWVSTKGEAREKFIKDYFNLPENMTSIAILAVGRLKNINDNYYKNRFDKSKLHFGKFEFNKV